MSTLSPGVVAGLGMTIVFSGLVFLVFIVWLMGIIVSRFAKNEPAPAPKTVPSSAPVSPVPAAPIENRAALIAAISACLAEELGTDVSSISIQSFRKI